jgi:hypothetical protein
MCSLVHSVRAAAATHLVHHGCAWCCSPVCLPLPTWMCGCAVGPLHICTSKAQQLFQWRWCACVHTPARVHQVCIAVAAVSLQGISGAGKRDWAWWGVGACWTCVHGRVWRWTWLTGAHCAENVQTDRARHCDGARLPVLGLGTAAIFQGASMPHGSPAECTSPTVVSVGACINPVMIVDSLTQSPTLHSGW